LSIVLSSCAYTRVVPLQSNTYPAIPESEVTIFVDENDLPKEYEKVALITTDYDSGFDKVKWNSVKKKCASIGCNGVYQKYEDRASQGEQIAGAIFGLYTTDKAEFIAIRYDDSDENYNDDAVDKTDDLVYEKSMSGIEQYLNSDNEKDIIEGLYSISRTTINNQTKTILADKTKIGKVAILKLEDDFFDIVEYYDEQRFSNDRPSIVGEVEIDNELSCTIRTFDDQNQLKEEHLIINYKHGFEIRFVEDNYTHIDMYTRE